MNRFVLIVLLCSSTAVLGATEPTAALAQRLAQEARSLQQDYHRLRENPNDPNMTKLDTQLDWVATRSESLATLLASADASRPSSTLSDVVYHKVSDLKGAVSDADDGVDYHLRFATADEVKKLDGLGFVSRWEQVSTSFRQLKRQLPGHFLSWLKDLRSGGE